MRVQEHYAKYVTSGGDGLTVLEDRAKDLGYIKNELVPEDLYNDPALFQASCGSGCPLLLPDGRPTPNDHVVMDLGCGAGHDVLLVASQFLPLEEENNNGNSQRKVIGVDVTPEMLLAAKQNAKRYPDLSSSKMVEFIEMDFGNPDSTFLTRFENRVDLILSNGVFNLCPQKDRAFQMIHRLLRPSGRLVFSDVMKLEGKDIDPNAKIATSINGDVFSS